MSDQIFAAYDFHSDIAANRPVAPTPANGRLYVFIATDTHVASIWDGTTWCSTGSGSAGAAGPVGPPGFAFEPDDPIEPFIVIGPTGARGTTGLSGTNGVIGPPGIDADDPPEPLIIPGPAGATGATGSAGSGIVVQPCGRITLTTGVPVMTSDVNAATTIFYTPYNGATIPLFDGTSVWTMTTFTEVSQALSDTTKSPLAAVGGKLYDVFGWSDAGTFRATRGPAWASSSGRGTGAGTTELIYQDGILVNKIAITNGPAAKKGTFLGTIQLSGLGSVNFITSTPGGAGGTTIASRLDVWNMYNRVNIVCVNIDTTASYTYSLLTWREKNGSAGNEIIFLCGWVEDHFMAASNENAANSTAAGLAFCGVGFNSTTVPSVASILGTMVAGKQASATATMVGRPLLGTNFVTPLEEAQAAGVTTWQGVGAAAVSAIVLHFRM